MSVAPRRLINALTQHCAEVPERVPGYREALLEQLAEIMTAEREATIRRLNIQQKVSDCCEVLGEYLARSGNPSEAKE